MKALCSRMGPISIMHLNILLDFHCIMYRVYDVKLKNKILKGSLIILKVELSDTPLGGLIVCETMHCIL